MTTTQIKNLYRFYCLNNTLVEDFLKNSPDYILEKYDQLISIPLSDKKYNEIQIDPLFIEWKEVWVRDDRYELPDSLIKFILKIYPIKEKYDINRYLSFKDLLKYFKEYIGDPLKISKEDYKLHPLTEDLLDSVVESAISNNKDVIRELNLDYLKI